MMLKWINTQLSKVKAAHREFQIRLAFPAYEARKRSEHFEESLRKFPTGALEQELHNKLAKVREEIRIKYAGPMIVLEKEITQLQVEIRRTNTELSIFQHPYKAELDPLFGAIQSLSAEMNAAQRAKQEAYSRLEIAKERIANWHAKSKRSPYLFGNGASALPKHSLFGQSFADLDGYKSDRSAAIDDIQRYKNKIAVLQNQRDGIAQKISQIKISRQKMADLREQGRSVRGLQSQLARQSDILRERSAQLSQLSHERERILDVERYRAGSVEIERMILAIKLKRDDFIQSFDAPTVAAARFAACTEDWINAHGS